MKHPSGEPVLQLPEVRAEVAIGRWETGGREAFAITCALLDTILPITNREAILGSQLLDEHGIMAARDAIHAAVVMTNGLDGICSFDRDFDLVETVCRYKPNAHGDPSCMILRQGRLKQSFVWVGDMNLRIHQQQP